MKQLGNTCIIFTTKICPGNTYGKAPGEDLLNDRVSRGAYQPVALVVD